MSAPKANVPVLLTTRDAVLTMVDALRRADAIAVDTEFIRETTFFPKVALIQVATRQETWLVDPLAFSPDDLKPLLEVLKDPAILKVMHAAHSDQECFYTGYGLLISPVLDTAVAAALVGMGDNLGLGRLLKELLNLTLPKGRARARWLTRPLPLELLEYAEQDVAHLVELGDRLAEKLRSKGRYDWALQESAADLAVFEVTPEEMADRVAKSGSIDPSSYAVLIELFRWRENRARKGNLPRPWVADNETLIALSKVRPKNIDELRHFRGLNPKEVERSGKDIMEAVNRGKNAPKEAMPRGKRHPPPTQKEEHIIDLIGSYVAFLAAKHEIATRFLLSSARIYALWINRQRSTEEWVKEEILSPNAIALIGEDLKALLSGKRGLAIQNGGVETISL